MRSIVRVVDTVDIQETIKVIEATTRAKVAGYEHYLSWYRIDVVHSEGQTCQNCGNEIHIYGHGLCKTCWYSLRDEIEAIS